MTEPTPAPAASQHRRPGWRDPRILVGVLILAGSVLIGAMVFDAADETVGVWAASADLPAGTRVGADDVRRVELRFVADEDADRYLSADSAVPPDAVLSRPVTAGELLPRKALGRQQALIEVPLAVEVDNVPATIAQGGIVDVWVSPTTAQAGEKSVKARLVLEDVVVLAAPAARDSLAPSGTRQVIVGVEPETSDQLETALGTITNGRVVLTREG